MLSVAKVVRVLVVVMSLSACEAWRERAEIKTDNNRERGREKETKYREQQIP